VGIFVDRSAVHPPRRPPQGEREGNLAVRVKYRGRDGSELVEIGAVERVRVVALRGGLDEFPERAGREVGVRLVNASVTGAKASLTVFSTELVSVVIGGLSILRV
jgi:hypothetical protein